MLRRLLPALCAVAILSACASTPQQNDRLSAARSAYEQARARSLRAAGTDGIDRLLADHRVSVLVAPTEGPAWPIDLVLGDHFAGGIGAGLGQVFEAGGRPDLSVIFSPGILLPLLGLAALSLLGAWWRGRQRPG